MLTIRSGPYDVIHSGTVIGFGSHPIEMSFGPKQDSLQFRFVFHDTNIPDGKEGKTNWKKVGEKALELTFYKTGSHAMGYGNKDAVRVGTYQKRKLYLYYRIYTLSELPERLLHYTFYLGEEVTNG